MFRTNQFNRTTGLARIQRIFTVTLVLAVAVLAQGCASMETRQGSQGWNQVFRAVANDINARQAEINRQNSIQREMIRVQNGARSQQLQQPVRRSCAWNDYWCQTNTRGY